LSVSNPEAASIKLPFFKKKKKRKIKETRVDVSVLAPLKRNQV